ncbi:MAG: DUF3179 domain-containing (seleno)protein [Chloroflexota bacterium]
MRIYLMWLLIGLAFAGAACAPADSIGSSASAELPAITAAPDKKAENISPAVAAEAPPTLTKTKAPTITATAVPIETAVATTEATLPAPTAVTPTVDPAEKPPAGAVNQFRTDFKIHSIPYNEIFSGGPPKDGIPAIDSPQFVSVNEAGEWLGDLEPVTVFQEQGVVRVYPFQILMWHEIVNDVVNGRAIAVTFCPLCNTAIVFDATVNGQSLDFGTTGRLRFSNLLMYDRQTQSWWQQASGEAVVGKLTGSQLTFLPSSIISWAEARDKYPDAQVLSRETGHQRRYGSNPYLGYDNITGSPVLFQGQVSDQLPAMARVTTVDMNDEAVAYPNEVLQELGVVNDRVGGIDVVVFWQPGLASALDSSSIAAGQDVGANGVFERILNGQTLAFTVNDDVITDEQTNSTWNIFGEATAGELAGEVLTPVVKVDHFWFSWAAFRPDTRIYQQP